MVTLYADDIADEPEPTMLELDELELAYAVTIHKSQGSEYPVVIMPILSGPKMLLNRNLLYTAVTRARSCVTILGSSETVLEMIKNKQDKLEKVHKIIRFLYFLLDRLP